MIGLGSSELMIISFLFVVFKIGLFVYVVSLLIRIVRAVEKIAGALPDVTISRGGE